MDDRELHGVRGLIARNSTERGVWWQVRSGVERICFSLHTSAGVNNSSSTESCGIMLVLTRPLFLIGIENLIYMKKNLLRFVKWLLRAYKYRQLRP